MTLRLAPEVRARLAEWARLARPREGCGLLIGRRTAGGARAERAIWTANLAAGADRFEVDPAGYLLAERAARAAGAAVVGAWHSHPEGAAKPSPLDRARALPGWSHVIVGLAGRAPDVRSYRLRGGRLVEEACA